MTTAGTPPDEDSPQDDPLHWLPSRKELSGWLKACAPKEPIGPDDLRYLPMEQLRGVDAIERLYDIITLKDSSCQLFSGFSGTGKSSELLRLKGSLEDQGYTVLLVDAEDYHDLYHPLALEELLVMIAGAFGDATSTLLDKPLPKEGYWGRIRDFIQREVEVNAFGLNAGAADIKYTLKHSRPFWLKVQDQLANSTSRLREHAHAFVAECVAQLRARFRQTKGIVFILDSLERLRGLESEMRTIMASVVRVFGENTKSLRLPDCHCVYTLPPYLNMLDPQVASRYDGQARILPAIRVYQRGGGQRPAPEGVAALRLLVAKRIPIERIFGARGDLLDKLILQSGGHLRQLMEFLSEVLLGGLRKGFPPQDKHIDVVLAFFGEKAGLAITAEGISLLERIQASGTVSGLGEDALVEVARFMDTRIVLCYRNGGGWYEVHPLVRKTLARLVAYERELKQREQAALRLQALKLELAVLQQQAPQLRPPVPPLAQLPSTSPPPALAAAAPPSPAAPAAPAPSPSDDDEGS